MSRLRLIAVVVALPLSLWLFVPVLSDGAPLSSRIEEKRRAIEQKKGRERVLTTTISGYTQRINALQGDITDLQTRQVRIEADLTAKRAELERLQDLLREERIRLVRLRARLAESRAALSERLVELYKADEPDVVTVILEADGFAELLERAEFMQRVSEQDARIIDRVRTAKAEAVATEQRLDRLENRQRQVTAVVADRRQEVVDVKEQLVSRREEYQGVRYQKSQVLVDTREQRHDLEGDLRALEKEQAAVLAKLQAAEGGGGPAGPVRQGSGSMIWPVNGPWCRRSACAGAACTRGWTSPFRQERRSGPRTPAASYCSAGPAATATTPVSRTAAGSRPATRTSRATRRRAARA